MWRTTLAAVSMVAAMLTAAAADAMAAGKTIPVFTLKGVLTEKPAADDFPFGPLGVESFRDLIGRIDKAADDPKVPAVVLFYEDAALGYAQLEELRHAFDRLKAKGKKVYSHSDWTMTGGFAVLAAADRLSMTPTGYLFITGIYGEQLYIRGLLDKLGVQPDFVTCGEYKSAAEMFMRTAPSPQAAEMYKWLYDGLYEGVVQVIAAGRKVDPAKAREWINTGLYSAETAQAAGLIDAVEHRSEFVAHIEKEYGDDVKFDRKYGKKQQPTIDLNNPFDVLNLYMQLLTGPQTQRPSTKDAVAIIYIEGNILPGSPEPSPFGATEGAYSDPIRKALDKALEDDTIKAVVLRVDSPGGSAVASEVMLQASQRVAARKPLIVSMGNIAGSGGYYVTLGSKHVFADANTITGSIGVLGGKLATTDMWAKIGVTFNPIERGDRAGMLGTSKIFTDAERAHFQHWMDEVYAAFKQHVVDIRGDKLKQPIDELAGGRVFTGKQALEFGLVDAIGTLEDAIKKAAAEAKIEKYEVRVIPRPENFLEVLMSDLTGQQDEDTQRLSLRIPTVPPASLWDAAAPLLQGFDPQRTRLVQQALQQLDLMQAEQLLLSAPVLDVRLK